ncbi:gamma-glutamyl-gamma-aminobutyrate hydrolase family protein [Streptomyces sp. NPDC127068]|uniref:gamma-glutamyl-gamma-aminobutyrate hydrolase family protein n=1 Tax=Streptomyces sp. NPDC127068 TaxID=3347127 RepID=UPI0036684A08
MRPLVAVTGMPSTHVRGLRAHGVAAAEKVLDAVFRAGGDPVVLYPSGHPVEPLLARFDAVLLPDGGDVDPRHYATTPRRPLPAQGAACAPGHSVESSATWSRAEPAQDVFELAVARHAVAQDLPLLAVCRGMHVVNVALGGTLIRELTHGKVPHQQGFHRVRLKPGSRVALAMGREEAVVSSRHHQAVDRLGCGLSIAGRAADGVIEALEHHSAHLLAVQWRPEDNADLAVEEQALFNDLVERARDRGRTRS